MKLFLSLAIFLSLLTDLHPALAFTGEPIRTPPEVILQEMTLREKVGRLFFIRPEQLYIPGIGGASPVRLTDEMAAAYEKYPAGGFVLFRNNLEGEEQLAELTGGLHGLSVSAPLICIDEEGGSVARIANSGLFPVPKAPGMQKIASKGDPGAARAIAHTIGAYLSSYGIDVDLAPVADVNTNPDNAVIGSRAFGSDPYLASEMACAYLDGLHSAGIKGCFKHYPGHGDTSVDTHTGSADTMKTWEELLSCELIPFIAGIHGGTDMIMAAHIAAPRVTGDDTPATLSYTLLTEKLRGELGFTGVIVTDAMDMGAITEYYSAGDAAVQAILAGADIVLLPKDYTEAFDSVLEAVENGTISVQRLDESVYRILTMKAG